MPRARSIPKRVWIGPHLYITVSICSQAVIKEALEEDDSSGDVHGCWIGNEDKEACVGTIYIDRGVRKSLKERWATLRHELGHAIHDVEDWIARGLLE